MTKEEYDDHFKKIGRAKSDGILFSEDHSLEALDQAVDEALSEVLAEVATNPLAIRTWQYKIKRFARWFVLGLLVVIL